MYMWLVRHGRYEPGVDGFLTAQGRDEAQRTAGRLSSVGITHLICSPLLRALDTAAIIAPRLDLPLTVWPELREGFSNSHAAWSRVQLLERYPGLILPEGFAEKGWEHGNDTYESMLERGARVLERLLADYRPTDRVVMIAHGGFINHLLHTIVGIPPGAPSWFEMDYCAISRVRLVPENERRGWPLYPPVRAEIQSINDVAHLPLGSQETSRTD